MFQLVRDDVFKHFLCSKGLKKNVPFHSMIEEGTVDIFIHTIGLDNMV